MYITNEAITRLESNEIFVFGSNEAGRHGRGAAKAALKFGATYGYSVGLCGRTYAIPTKNKNIQTLPIIEIKKYVDDFCLFVLSRQELFFLITPIECGLAGYKPEQIAPLFNKIKNCNNVSIPDKFYRILYK